MEPMNAMLMNLILQIILVSALAACNSFLSYLLDYCFWDQSIFARWLPWLAKKLVRSKNVKEHNKILAMPENLRDQKFIDEAQGYFLYKIMGGCIVCTNVWLAMITFIPVWIFAGAYWWCLFPYVVFSSFLLRKIDR
jgi:hypothetical protein